ncbi:PREDICTED: alpha-glucosidase-like [Vollenhovia emeryi]|uniref:alpha-glucosidase-like n=1 Tax=Vollenhovia emeryi TaxID=411798 RepID=UPI0005F4357A|nr:PREDICTED: alpha-glucosidase-like [Vollenhovia emeryi]
MLALGRYITLTSIFILWTNGMDNEEVVERAWQDTTLIYQIWPRGFQDSDGDGEGDLKGIISRLDYIEDLGIETIWLNPIYPSPLIDSGYDVSNYTDIEPLFGDLSDFDNLMQKAHDRGLKVMLDIIPNHSSDQHEWFELSAKNVEPYTDYYIWANGSIDENGHNIPPNNWISTYSDEEGSAWTWHDGRQQWYYHKYHSSQPDLNLRNEKVVKELMGIFDFWLARNVDGFRINAVPYFFEDEALRNESFAGEGTYTFGLPESTALLYVFREHIESWVSRNNALSKLLVAESYDTSDDNLLAYYGNGTHKGIAPFNFKFITHIHNSSYSDAGDIKYILEKWLKSLPKDTKTNWVLSNHDNSRAATRIGLNRVDGLHMLSLLLPGQAYTYYGDEIAMLDSEIFWSRTIDPMGCARGINEYKSFSRDPARTPMQWNSEISAGFSTNETTYLPTHPDYVYRNVEIQQSKERSNLKTYKELAVLRKEPVFINGNYEFANLNNNRVLVLKRSLKNHPVYIVVINLGIRTEEINLTSICANLKDTLDIIVASSNAIGVTGAVSRDKFTLTANAALVLKGEEEQVTTKPTTTSEATTPVNHTTESTTEKEKRSTSIKPETSEKPDNAMSIGPSFLLMISTVIVILSCRF